jgi:ATP-dependent protease HslVU (ClpYQ) peptidase subunit
VQNGPVTDVGLWLEQHADRTAARQRSQVDTAKLVTTFATGVAAALVATAIQVPGISKREVWSIWALAAAVALTILGVFADRLKEASHDHLIERSKIEGWDDDTLVRRLRAAMVAAVRLNEGVVTLVRVVAVTQVLVASASGALATWSLQ